MLKITVTPLMGKASVHKFETVEDALKFLKSIDGSKPAPRGPTLRAAKRSEQKRACGCKILEVEGEEHLLWDFQCKKHAPASERSGVR